MASQEFENGELLGSVREKINGNFLTIDQRVAQLEEAVGNVTENPYVLPVGGIPQTDLAVDIQEQLGQASTAYQKPVDGIPAADLALPITEDIQKGVEAFNKLDDGISYAELIPNIVNSLAKADEALPASNPAVAVEHTITFGASGEVAPVVFDGSADKAVGRNTLGAAASGNNTDITRLSGITGGVEEVDYVRFDLTPETVPATPGSMYWDASPNAQTVAVVMESNKATLLAGQETYYRVKASEPVRNGKVVMFNGSQGASGVLLVKEAENIAVDKAHLVMGISTHDMAANEFGYITWFGQVNGIDTRGLNEGEVWAEGDILYYNPTTKGNLTKVRPPVPNPIALMVVVVKAHQTQGSLFVRPQYGSVLGGTDGNVQFTNLTDKNFISYNAIAQRWENYTPSQSRTNLGLGDLAVQNANALTIKPQASASPTANGDMVFRLVDNSTLEVRVKGTDGVTRKATLSLTVV